MWPRSRATTSGRWAYGPALLVLLVVGVLAWAPLAARADPLDDAVLHAARQLACPVCEGQSVADSNSGLAKDMRDVIRTKLQAGVSEQQILDDFVAAYGPGILTEPPKQGVSLGVWIGPLAGVLIGVLLLAGIAPQWLRRGQRPSPSPASPRAPGVDSAVVDELRQYRERVGA